MRDFSPIAFPDANNCTRWRVKKKEKSIKLIDAGPNKLWKIQCHPVIPVKTVRYPINIKGRGVNCDATILGFPQKRHSVQKNQLSVAETRTWSWESGRRQRPPLCMAGRTSYPTRSCTESTLTRFRGSILFAEDPEQRIKFQNTRSRSFEKLSDFVENKIFCYRVYLHFIYKNFVLSTTLPQKGSYSPDPCQVPFRIRVQTRHIKIS